MLSLLQYSRSRFWAALDSLSLLHEAAKLSISLSASEVNTICYFGRLSAHAWHEIVNQEAVDFPYAFTYGFSGGPISSDIVEVLDNLIFSGYVIYTNPPDAQDLRLYAPHPFAIDLLKEIERGAVSEPQATPFLQAIIRAVPSGSVASLINTIKNEPSLADARSQHLREGVPLGGKRDEVVAWLRSILVHDDLRVQVQHSSSTLATILLDALAWAEHHAHSPHASS